jgi:hypothetical protein
MLLCDYNEALLSNNLDLINEQIKHLQSKLIFLETIECRKNLAKQIIDDERKETTNKFKLIINKRHFLLKMQYESSDEE